MACLMDMCTLHLGAPESHPYENEDAYREAIFQATDLVRAADAIVVGIGSGMSSACGYDFYQRTDEFDNRFARFERVHGIRNLMEGFYHAYATNEERWAYLAEYITYLEDCPVGQAYQALRELLADKPHTILTTNVDGQVRRAFPTQSTWLFQGDFGYLQCAQPCCDELTYALPAMRAICDAVGPEGLAAPSDLLPRCPHCGWLQVPWVRDDTFCEQGRWQQEKQRYERFVSEAIAGADRVLFMELGVGGMTPSIIEIPFWRMVAGNENAFYLRINKGKAGEPQQLEGRPLTVTADLADALGHMAHRDAACGQNR